MSHIAVVCSKCGMTGRSKNPYTRSVFADRVHELPHLPILELSVPTYVEKVGEREYINIRTMVYEKISDHDTDVGVTGALQRIVDVLSEVIAAGDNVIAMFTCEHDWIPASKEEAEKMIV